MVLPIEDINTEPESVVLKRKSEGEVKEEIEVTAKSKVSVTEVEAPGDQCDQSDGSVPSGGASDAQ